MTALVDATLKVSLITLVALAAVWLVRHRSAAMRHWILAAAIACAAISPLLGPVVPSWRVELVPAEGAVQVGSRNGSTSRSNRRRAEERDAIDVQTVVTPADVAARCPIGRNRHRVGSRPLDRGRRGEFRSSAHGRRSPSFPRTAVRARVARAVDRNRRECRTRLRTAPYAARPAKSASGVARDMGVQAVQSHRAGGSPGMVNGSDPHRARSRAGARAQAGLAHAAGRRDAAMRLLVQPARLDVFEPPAPGKRTGVRRRCVAGGDRGIHVRRAPAGDCARVSSAPPRLVAGAGDRPFDKP